MKPAELAAKEIAKPLSESIPARIALRYCVLPLAEENGILRLAAPLDFPMKTKEELKILLGLPLEFVPAVREEIQAAIEKFYGAGAEIIDSLVKEKRSQGGTSQDFEAAFEENQEEATISRLVHEWMMDAVKSRASDIHIEPFEKSLRIRYRVDGQLLAARVSERIQSLAPNIISRIKIMARLDIGEKRLPQDGRIKIKQNGEELDLRVSVLPSSYGEAIVIRILRPLRLLNLSELGFDSRSLVEIETHLGKPHGMILVTGPTGSGKTTTLYACLSRLNRIERKIITVEDPIEYKLPGIIQMQVSPKIGFTFAQALRAMLRHDPDCLMVGEIRDAETAEIAIRSALTGHLVLSTLHTNDAPSAATRLLEMGIEPYLAASSIEAVMAQRLVRTLCTQQKNHRDCAHCSGTGYYGRTAIYEIMRIDETIRTMIAEKKSASLIRKQALQNGMISLAEYGAAKIREGVTDEPEMHRVAASTA